MTMREFSAFVRSAETAAPQAARNLLTALRDGKGNAEMRAICKRLLRFERVDPALIDRFEKAQVALRVGVKPGRPIAWLVPRGWTTALLPPAPKVSMYGMFRLACALGEELRK